MTKIFLSIPNYLFRFMKWTFIVFTAILTALLSAKAADTFAQASLDAKITIEVENVTLKAALKALSQKAKVDLAYNTRELPLQEKVNIKADGEPLGTVLGRLVTPLGLTYKVIGKNIIIEKAEKKSDKASVVIAPQVQTAVAADITVTGTVTDENGQTLPGVNIKVKNTGATLAVTNSEGVYSLKAPASSILVFSYVGFNAKEVKVDGNGTITMNVMLEPSFGAMKEVVIVGYGKQTKQLLTGSVSVVSGNDLVQVPNPNITQSLAGRVSGLIAYSRGGIPGSNDATLLIRGLSTTGDNSPLIVIDGVVRSNFVNANGTNSPMNINPMSYLDPNDIESISILKDAAATAIYGARAANGAILITTKRGANGTPQITYSANFGVQKSTFIGQPLSSYQIASLWNQAWQNEGTFSPTPGGAKGFTPAALDTIQNGTDPNRYANTNWYKAIYGTSPAQTEHNISISGGSQKMSYFVSGGFFDQDGFYPSANFKRYNIRSNLDGKISNNLSFTLDMSGRQEQANNPAGNPASALTLSPLNPIRYSNGEYYYYPNTKGNPYLVAQGNGGFNDMTKDYFESEGTLTYKIPGIEGLSVKGLLSFDKYYVFSKYFSETYDAYTLNANNTYTLPLALSSAQPSLLETYNQYQSLTQEASVNYEHSFGKHNVNGLLLYTQTQNTGDVFSAQRTNFPSAILDQLNEGSLTGQTNNGSGLESARRGYVARLGYNYDLKYLFEFDGRYDGSDLFPPGHRYGFFPAVSAGWRLSEEDFIKDNLPFVTNLKLRASWGEAGNDRAGAFQYLNSYAISSISAYGFGGTAATPSSILNLATLANSVFTWERATTTDIGLEANLWKDMLGIDVDVYKKRTSDILLSLASQIPDVFGAPPNTLPLENYGIVDNKGIEIQLSHQNHIGAFGYFIRPTITFYQSDVVRYPQGASVPTGQRLQGKPVAPDAVIGYVAQGLYQSQAQITSGPTPLYANTSPGDIRYKDINGDGKITPADEVIISKGITPQTIFGVNMGFAYKNFDANVFFQGAADASIYLPTQLTEPFYYYNPYPIAYSLQENNWTPANTSATYPRLTVTSQNNLQPSTYWLRNSAYLRLKNAEIGYTLPNDWLYKIGFKGARIFVNGSNLITWSHVGNLIDPEGLYTTYPMIKVYNLGLTVKF